MFKKFLWLGFILISCESVHVHKPEVQAPPKVQKAPEEILTIRREILIQYLDRGPAYVLKQVPVKPVMNHGRFVGYEILAFFPGMAVMSKVDLHPGDIVLSINAQRIQDPNAFFQIWESLRTAPAIKVDLIRRGKKIQKIWKIIDEPTPSSPESRSPIP